MKRLLEMAVRDDTVGSNHDQMRKFVDFIKYDTPSYPEALSMILIRFKNSEGISSIHCLNLLDLCMEQLGHPFIIYVDRYNVLNMFVKRVHPKYDEWNTPEVVKKKIIQTLDSWGKKYTTYPKIVTTRERIQQCGFIPPPNNDESSTEASRSSLGDDFSNYQLKSLLKNPTRENITAANFIIKDMVKQKEDEVKRSVGYLDHSMLVKEHCSIIELMIQNNEKFTEDDLETLKDVAEKCQQHLKKLQKECDEAAAREDPLLQNLLESADKALDTLKRYQEFIKDTSKRKKDSEKQQDDEPLFIFQPIETDATQNNQLQNPPSSQDGKSLIDDLDFLSFGLGSSVVDQKSSPQPTPTVVPANKPTDLFEEFFK